MKQKPVDALIMKQLTRHCLRLSKSPELSNYILSLLFSSYTNRIIKVTTSWGFHRCNVPDYFLIMRLLMET